jgi:hypothetical protein
MSPILLTIYKPIDLIKLKLPLGIHNVYQISNKLSIKLWWALYWLTHSEGVEILLFSVLRSDIKRRPFK